MTETRKPDYALWDRLETFNLDDAAFLWCDIAPPEKHQWPIKAPYGKDIMRTIKRLERLSENKDPVSDMWRVSRGLMPDSVRVITRTALLAAADVYQVRPAFLFPEERAVESRQESEKPGRREQQIAVLRKAIKEQNHDPNKELPRGAVAKIRNIVMESNPRLFQSVYVFEHAWKESPFKGHDTRK